VNTRFICYTKENTYPIDEGGKKEIDRMVDGGMIESVNYPTDCCAPIVAITKPSAVVRICVDFTQLTESIRREHCIIPKGETTLASTARRKMNRLL